MSKIFLTLLLTALALPAWSAQWQYRLRVDGLACPYCAYGIEKKIKALDGVDETSVEIKLNDGLVLFQANTLEPMTESSLKTLINDAGFTLRQFQVQPLKPKNE